MSDTDRVAWLVLLEQIRERFNWRSHVHCQMTNHYHLVLETQEGNLAQFNGGHTVFQVDTNCKS